MRGYSMSFQTDTPTLSTFIVLMAVGAISLLLSILMGYKLYKIRKLGYKSITVFTKTFNILDPVPLRGRVMGDINIFLPGLIIVGILCTSFLAAAKILESGLELSLIILISCIGVLMLEEANEARRNANIFAKAHQNDTGFAKGDMSAMEFLRSVLGKLTAYYFSLAIVLFAIGLTVEYAQPGAILAFAYSIAPALSITAPENTILPQLAMPLFLVAFALIQLAAAKAKKKFFEFHYE
jgi:hypothetical protein